MIAVISTVFDRVLMWEEYQIVKKRNERRKYTNNINNNKKHTKNLSIKVGCSQF